MHYFAVTRDSQQKLRQCYLQPRTFTIESGRCKAVLGEGCRGVLVLKSPGRFYFVATLSVTAVDVVVPRETRLIYPLGAVRSSETALSIIATAYFCVVIPREAAGPSEVPHQPVYLSRHSRASQPRTAILSCRAQRDIPSGITTDRKLSEPSTTIYPALNADS